MVNNDTVVAAVVFWILVVLLFNSVLNCVLTFVVLNIMITI